MSRLIRRTWFWLALALIAFLLAGLDKLHREKELSPLDTAVYFQNAVEIKHNGGPFAILPRCVEGRFLTTNQMPLYLAIISALPVDKVEGLAWVRLATLLIGASGIVVTFLVAKKVFGRAEAFIAASLLALNTAWLWHSTITACETLLGILITLLWLALILHLRGRRVGLLLGLLLGLALMTKATALLLIPAVAVAFIWKARWKIFLSRQAWLAALACIVICLPILIRNARAYGSPFYSISAHARGVFGETRQESVAGKYSSLGEYVKSRGVLFAARRVVSGLPQMAVYAVVGSGQTYPLSERLHWKVWPVGLLTLLLMALTFFRRRSRRPAVIAGALFITFALFFAWFFAKDMRYVMPLLPIGLILAARGLSDLARLLSARLRAAGKKCNAQWILAPVAVLLLTSIALAASSPNVRKNPLDSTPFPPGYFELLQWLGQHAKNEKWVMGPSQVYVYYWLDRLPGQSSFIPWTEDMEQLQDFLHREKIRHLVLDYSTLKDSRFLLGDFFLLSGDTIKIVKTPANWREIFSTPGAEETYLVFEIS